MEEIQRTASAYHASLSDEQKKFAEKMFKALDLNTDGKIGFGVYKAVLASQEKHVKGLTDPRLFKNLDSNKDGFLDKQDIITLSYLIESRIIHVVLFCNNCEELVLLHYFTCLQCHNSSTDGTFYKLCSSCYRSGKHNHHRDAKFLDRDSLLRSAKSNQSSAQSAQRVQKSAVGNSRQLGVQKKSLLADPTILLAGVLTSAVGGYVGREMFNGTDALIHYFNPHKDASPLSTVADPSAHNQSTPDFSTSGTDFGSSSHSNSVDLSSFAPDFGSSSYGSSVDLSSFAPDFGSSSYGSSVDFSSFAPDFGSSSHSNSVDLSSYAPDFGSSSYGSAVDFSPFASDFGSSSYSNSVDLSSFAPHFLPSSYGSSVDFSSSFADAASSSSDTASSFIDFFANLFG